MNGPGVREVRCDKCQAVTRHELRENYFHCALCGEPSLEEPDCEDFGNPECEDCPNQQECWP